MFNPERKNQYLEYCGKDRKVSALFKYTERFEKEIGKDLCEMQTQDLLDILKTMRKSTAISERSRLIKYIEWCRANGFCKINGLDKKNCPRDKFLAVLDAAEDKYYISPSTYQEYVKILDGSPNADYDASIFMAIYEGVTDYTDLAYLTTDDIDFKNGTISLHTCGEIKVSDGLLKRLMVASRVEELIHAKQRSAVSHGFRNQMNSIWKSTQELEEYGQVQKFRRRMLKIKEILGDDKISISNLSNSGIFNYVLARTREDGIDILGDVYDCSLSRNQLNMKYQSYFQEKKLALNFWEFKYRFQDYFKYLSQQNE